LFCGLPPGLTPAPPVPGAGWTVPLVPKLLVGGAALLAEKLPVNCVPCQGTAGTGKSLQ
jgi:hypothetical protein